MFHSNRDLTVRPPALASLDALTSVTGLREVLSLDIQDVRIEPLSGVGYSNAALSRVHVTTRGGERKTLVLKRTRLDADWTARRTEDIRGRERLLLSESALSAVWNVFACPYVAFAVESGTVGLLLCDLSADLLPDVRAPLSESQESGLLGALARLHARFWGAAVPALDWLVRPAQYCDMLAPCVAADPHALAVLSSTMRETVPRGWASALARLPAEAARYLTGSGVERERLWADLPWTFLHGDAKVANFALLADGRIAAFDWAVAGTGPCGIDLGWYLAVNASRLTGSKETMMMRYRNLLETALGKSLPDTIWRRLECIAVVCGARMLLWSKALALDAGRPGAAEEWNWWVDRLAAIGTVAV